MTDTPSPQEQQVLTEVLQAMRTLKHGSINLIVQDARVIQIDTLAKHRLERPHA